MTEKRHTPRGAPLGRHDETLTANPVSLRYVRLDRGGYDSHGTYWGVGIPLWRAQDAEGRVRHVRAVDRDAAKAHVLMHWAGARFYR